MRITRMTLCALGGGIALWGVWLLLTTQRIDQLLSVAIWLAGAVVVHDFVLVPALNLMRRRGSSRRPRE